MPSSTVHVQYGDGGAAKQVRVELGFTSGMTRDAFTNNYGDAVVDHASTGQADV